MIRLGIILPAAGSGTRFDPYTPKIFWPIANHPVLFWTLRALLQYPWPVPTQVVIATQKQDLPLIKKIFQDVQKSTLILPEMKYCLGGNTREISVRNAIAQLSDVTHVLIHDAARPALPSDMIDRLLTSLHLPCTIPVLPCVDTLKEVHNNQVSRTVPRDTLYRVQTPQLFAYASLIDAYTQPAANTTDEAGLCETIGIPVATVRGDSRAMKLTHKDELPLVTACIRDVFQV